MGLIDCWLICESKLLALLTLLGFTIATSAHTTQLKFRTCVRFLETCTTYASHSGLPISMQSTTLPGRNVKASRQRHISHGGDAASCTTTSNVQHLLHAAFTQQHDTWSQSRNTKGPFSQAHPPWFVSHFTKPPKAEGASLGLD